jgi:hypothetical protein
MPQPSNQSHQPEQDALARRIATAFHDTDCLRQYQICCRKYPAAVVQKAFQDARSFPPAQIKKSRAAIFFYLVKHYAHQASYNSGT